MSWFNKYSRVFISLLLFLSISFVYLKTCTARDWSELKGKHFLVYYDDEISLSWASRVLREAERNYSKIAREIGYTKYTNFWTWDKRVSIYIYPDHEAFVIETGLPEWSSGMARRDKYTMSGRIIASYKQEKVFLNGVLPHEITHLVLKDFIGEKCPLWFQEGMAQLQEEEKLAQVRKLMPKLVKNNEYFPLKHLLLYDIRLETEPRTVSLFYMQSISVLDFLIKRYGNFKFGELCLSMKSGKDFSQALKTVYSSQISSIPDLEKKWLSYMQFP